MRRRLEYVVINERHKHMKLKSIKSLKISNHHKTYILKNSFILIVIVVLISLISLSSVRADDTLVGGNGYMAYPLHTDKIQMLSEHVIIRMGSYNSKEAGSNTRRAFVHCTFVFKNISNKEIKATVGFPTSTYNGYGGVILPNLNDFSSYINGRPVKVKIKKEIIGKKYKISVTTPTYPYYEGGPKTVKPYRFWYTWKVNFPASKKIILKNSYWVTLSSGWGTCWLEYILTTGANWQGKIGKAVIEVIYPTANDLKSLVIFDKVEPKEFMTFGNKIYWEFKNFKPKTNIRITEKAYANDLNN